MKKTVLILLVTTILTSCLATKKDLEVASAEQNASFSAKMKVASEELQAEIARLNERISKIEEKLNISKEAQENKINMSFSSLDDLKKTIIELNNRIDSIDVDFQKNSSAVIKRIEEELDTLRAQIKIALDSGEKKPVEQITVNKKGDIKLPDDSEKAFKELTALTKSGDSNAEARELWELYEKKFPDKHSCEVVFYIGETYYNEKSYNNAIQHYRRIEKDFKDCKKIEASYLKIALSLYHLGKKDLAKKVLEGVYEMFPNPVNTELLDEIETLLKVKKPSSPKKDSSKKESKEKPVKKDKK